MDTERRESHQRNHWLKFRGPDAEESKGTPQPGLYHRRTSRDREGSKRKCENGIVKTEPKAKFRQCRQQSVAGSAARSRPAGCDKTALSKLKTGNGKRETKPKAKFRQ